MRKHFLMHVLSESTVSEPVFQSSDGFRRARARLGARRTPSERRSTPAGSKGEGLDDAQAEEEPEDAVPEEPDAAPADVFPAMNRFLGIAAPGVVA